MSNKKQSELTVITRAKELCQYVLTVTDKSPKKFRFTLVSRLQNYPLSVIELLYRANSVYIDASGEGQKERRRLQQSAMVELRLLSYMSMVAREAQCILPKQQAQISAKAMETQRLLYAWVRSGERKKENG